MENRMLDLKNISRKWSTAIAIAATTGVAALFGGVASASAEELVLTNQEGTNVNEQPMSYESTNLSIATSGSAITANAHASRTRARAASALNIYLLTHPWVIIDLPAWDSIVGPAQNVFSTPFNAPMSSPAGGAVLESYNSGTEMIPWLGTINVTGKGTLKAITPRMRFALAIPGGPTCVFGAKQMKLTYPVGTPGNPVALQPAFKQAFSLDAVHSHGGTCPTKATVAGFFDVFTEDQAAPQQVFIQS
jgi:hypothetical protein